MYNGECDVVSVHKDSGDLVVLKTKENVELVKVIKEAVISSGYRSQLEQLNGYDLKMTGKVIYESWARKKLPVISVGSF